ncbi:Uncharacterised protein [Clostridium paraputrificum]|uniref:hypothetical protein n=1 Tax=Clostridium paraputrificum TaxID=29363 RepID=UPI0006C0BDE2|nr:hypothetical protein [Clostridium paraputrificum]CUQ55438.1 Uncharacterised protein [Clostridium paraputrificum]
MDNKQSIEQLKEICKPIVEWLKENYGPYYTVVIKDEHIRLVRDEVGISIETAQEIVTVAMRNIFSINGIHLISYLI